MGASRQAYWWERILHAIPGTTVWCPGGNQHFRWDRVCFCVDNARVALRFGRRWVVFADDDYVTTMRGVRYPSKVEAAWWRREKRRRWLHQHMPWLPKR